MTSPRPLHVMGTHRGPTAPRRPAPVPPPPAPTEQPYTVAEVAALMRVSKMTVYRLTTETGELPFQRIGRSIRIQPAALRRYLADITSDGAA